MLPRFTSGPNRRTSQACWSLRGASNRTRPTPAASTTASTTSRFGTAGAVEDPDGAALPALGDHPGGTGVEVARRSRPAHCRATGPPCGVLDSRSRPGRRRSRRHRSISSRFASSGIAATPRDTSTRRSPHRSAQARHSSARRCDQAISSRVPPRQPATSWAFSDGDLAGEPADRRTRCPSRTSRRRSVARRRRAARRSRPGSAPCRARGSGRRRAAWPDAAGSDRNDGPHVVYAMTTVYFATARVATDPARGAHDRRLDEVVAAVRSNPSVRRQGARSAWSSDVLGEHGLARRAGRRRRGAATPTGTGHRLRRGAAARRSSARDPYGAGIAAVLTNVNDLAAMGGLPLGIVDTIVGDEATARSRSRGHAVRLAAVRVPIVGGHLTISDGPTRRCRRSRWARAGRCSSVDERARPARTWSSRPASTATMRADFPFFPSFDERGERPRRRRPPAAHDRERRRSRWRPRTSAWPGWSGRWPCSWSGAPSA